MRVFRDTSAFVKKYIEEPGTDKVVEVCGRAGELLLSVKDKSRISSMDMTQLSKYHH